MLKRIAIAIVVGGLSLLSTMAPAHAAGISSKVGVCDPLYPDRCLKPAADGSIATTGGGGGSTTVKATAADPTYVEGSTTNPLSVDLSGYLRTLAKQSGTWNITNVSGTVSLPTGAATAAKQPALGTAGTASADVITVQGKSGMTALDVNIASGTITGTMSGTISNASDAVATNSNNLQGLSYNYGYNGATWDRLQVDANKFLKVVPNPYAATSTNGSTTIATGNTFQTILASNSSRKGCLIQNPVDATEVLYVSVGIALATPPTKAKSFQLAQGGVFNCRSGDMVITDEIDVTAVTSAHAFVEIHE